MVTKLNIVCCGYRSWADKIIENIRYDVNIVDVISDNEVFLAKAPTFQNIDFILFLGWSWIIPAEITSKYLCLGIHPSDLPMYRGGSPIQHQIIDGLQSTKVSLITLSDKLDAGDIWAKEECSLRGDNMNVIFDNIAEATTIMLRKFFPKFRETQPEIQDISKGTYYKRRTEDQSIVTFNELSSMDLDDIYNLCRSLSDPYPNLRVIDKNGNILMFNQIKFIKK